MRQSFLPFALPDTDETEIEAVADAIRSGWITTGPKTRQFEADFAAAVGAKHAIAVNSCTAAMHLALEATNLRPGDLVLTSPYTFAATAEVVRYFNATPIFVDVEAGSLNLNPDLLIQAVDDLVRGASTARRWLPPSLQHGKSDLNGAKKPSVQRLKSILPVHIAGLSAELNTVYTLAARHNLAVIEDAAHAFPAKYKGMTIGQPAIGGLPSAVCYSFYATKTITTGEGGMICTDDDDLAERCRVMTLHGISKDAWKRYTAEGSWYYEIIAPGYKYNMTDIAAAMGLVQLGKAERMWQRRLDIAQQYNQAFGEIAELQIPADRADCQHAWQLYLLRLNLDQLRLSRSQFIAELKARNIGTSVHFIPLHLHPYYRESYGYTPTDFPVAYSQFQRVVSLPIYSKMNQADVDDVIQSVLDIVAQHRKVQHKSASYSQSSGVAL